MRTKQNFRKIAPKVLEEERLQTKLSNWQTKEKNQNKSLLDYYGFTEKDIKEYPMVSSVLRQITPERTEREIEKIKNVKLPLELQKWVKEDEAAGGER